MIWPRPVTSIAAADAVVLLTDHDVFTPRDICRHARYVLDCRRVLYAPNVETLQEKRDSATGSSTGT